MKKFQDWMENKDFTDNDPNSMYVKYKNSETGESGHMLRGHAENEKNSAPNKEALSNFSQLKTPRSGVKAYSYYHGQEYIGVLVFENDPVHKDKLGNQGGPLSHNSGVDHPQHLVGATGYKVAPAFLMFPPGFSGVKNPSKMQTLSVGYDNPVVWDAKRGMFYAPADYD